MKVPLKDKSDYIYIFFNKEYEYFSCPRSYAVYQKKHK